MFVLLRPVVSDSGSRVPGADCFGPCGLRSRVGTSEIYPLGRRVCDRHVALRELIGPGSGRGVRLCREVGGKLLERCGVADRGRLAPSLREGPVG
jgi:hypothetical protein